MDTVKSLLENAKVNYEFIVHEKQLYSAIEGAEFFGIDVGQTAPTIIIRTDKGYCSVIFSGSRSRIDLVLIAQILGVSRAKLANKDKILEITGFAPGDTPMVGLTLPTILDRGLLQYPFVYGGSGQPNRTLKLPPIALITLNQPVAFLESD
jgi:prolyl-tRNA editing enzyme YbaK/EbsC (Cys-tRNA(Pro) deacylase)